MYKEDHLVLSGRADGIDLSEGIIVDEIKSTTRSIKDIIIAEEMHMAQLKLYAYIYAKKENLDRIGLRLIYIELESFGEKIFQQDVATEELEIYFNKVVELYMNFYHKVSVFEHDAMEAIDVIEFPFGDYRRGQKTLMRHVYHAIEDGDLLFSRAPTGIGKTIGTLFPALKALAYKNYHLKIKKIQQPMCPNYYNTIFLRLPIHYF
jgi:hypothetical protein